MLVYIPIRGDFFMNIEQLRKEIENNTVKRNIINLKIEKLVDNKDR